MRVAKDIAVQMCDVLDGGEYVGVLNAPNMAAARKAQLTPYVFLGEKIGALQAQLLGQGKVTLLACAYRKGGALAITTVIQTYLFHL